MRFMPRMERWHEQCCFHQKVKKDTCNDMDQNVHHMVSRQIVSMEIVIQSEADIGDRPAEGVASKEAYFFRFFPCETRQPDFGVYLNTIQIIKDEGAFQGVRIDQKNKENQEEKL